LITLGESSTTQIAIVKRAGFVPVVDQSTNATTVAAYAAMAACVVVIPKSSSTSGHRVSRNKTVVNEHTERMGAASRGRRRKYQPADDDVEPMDDASTSTASCKYS